MERTACTSLCVIEQTVQYGVLQCSTAYAICVLLSQYSTVRCIAPSTAYRPKYGVLPQPSTVYFRRLICRKHAVRTSTVYSRRHKWTNTPSFHEYTPKYGVFTPYVLLEARCIYAVLSTCISKAVTISRYLNTPYCREIIPRYLNTSYCTVISRYLNTPYCTVIRRTEYNAN